MPDRVGIDVEIAGRFQSASDGIANTVPAVASSRRGGASLGFHWIVRGFPRDSKEKSHDFGS